MILCRSLFAAFALVLLPGLLGNFPASAGGALAAAGAPPEEPLAVAAEEERGWSDTAELSYVVTGGNSETETLSFRNRLRRRWRRAAFTVDASGLRAESTGGDRRGVGGPGDFRVVDSSASELTAEKYALRGRYDRVLSERLFWFAAAGWDRNEFAGVANRVAAVAGAGHVWLDGEEAFLRTDYGVTVTRQEDVVEGPGEGTETFPGLRLSYDYRRGLTATTDYASTLAVDQNLDETSDLRADFVHSLSVAMSERLALSVSLQLLWDADPALEEIPLFAGEDASDADGTVLAELDSLDTILSTSLVVKF